MNIVPSKTRHSSKQVKCFIMMQHEFRSQAALGLKCAGDYMLKVVFRVMSLPTANGLCRALPRPWHRCDRQPDGHHSFGIASIRPSPAFALPDEPEAGQSKSWKLRSHHCHISAQQAVVATHLDTILRDDSYHIYTYHLHTTF